MKIKGLLISTVILFLMPKMGLTVENTFGIGASLNEPYFNTIYLPLNTLNYIFEVSVDVIQIDRKYSNSNIKLRSRTFGRFGLGIFKKLKNSDNIILYYGSRIGIIQYNTKVEYTGGSTTEEINGYFITPTLGFIYYFSRKISVAVDLGLDYVSRTDTITYKDYLAPDFTDSVELDPEITTTSNFIIRYDF